MGATARPATTVSRSISRRSYLDDSKTKKRTGAIPALSRALALTTLENLREEQSRFHEECLTIARGAGVPVRSRVNYAARDLFKGNVHAWDRLATYLGSFPLFDHPGHNAVRARIDVARSSDDGAG